MQHHVTKALPYTPDQLFALVGDVMAYPDFVPWINAMRTWNARTLADGVETLDAEAGVGFSFLKERFSTRVRRDATAQQIDVTLLSGPFKRLANRWQFFDDGAGRDSRRVRHRLQVQVAPAGGAPVRQFRPRGRPTDDLFRGPRAGALWRLDKVKAPAQ